MGGPVAATALIDCRGRAGSPGGDGAIGSLLAEWTGEQVDTSRSGWQDWLRRKAFSGFRRTAERGAER